MASDRASDGNQIEECVLVIPGEDKKIDSREDG